MEKKIDLHIHTNCSDGALTPFEVIDQAHANGVSVIAIADHDSVDAYNDELFSYAKEKGVTLIPAVEVSTKTKRAGVHVLGYNIDYKNEEFLKKLFTIRNARHDYLKDVSLKLNALGYVINTDELDKIDAVTKAHIALDVINNPTNYDILMREFGHKPDKGEFIETIMNEGCPAYAKKNSISLSEAASLIRSAGGKVVLAHPVAYKYEDGLNYDDTLNLIKELDADGVEANYIYIDKNNNKIDEVEYWNGFANDNNLRVTVGSDFHNDDGIHPFIGLRDEDVNLSSQEVDEMINWILS